MLRNPIITVLGHVDHGKTTLLDSIRKSRVADKEPGKITQHIGATNITSEYIKSFCDKKYEKVIENLKIKGLLFIDTPGHEAFINLRKRGGSIADLAILVVDVNEGFMPQTKESAEILKSFKTPFVVALNKVDAIKGWKIPDPVDNQIPTAKEDFYKKMYTTVMELNSFGFDSDLFTNINDFTKQIAIVPVSAKKNYGISELLMVLMGLAQQFLTKKLDIDVNSPGKGVILEVKEETGLGTTIDVILYDGNIKKNDDIVVGGNPTVATKVKNLLSPMPMKEMSDSKKFMSLEMVCAASGIKISALNLKNAIPGASVFVGSDTEKAKNEKTEISTGQTGVIIKADTLGSLEAISKILSDKDIPITRGSIGKVSKEDVLNALATGSKEKDYGVIFAFNTKVLEDAQELAKEKNVKIFENNTIYKIFDEYAEWLKREKIAVLKPAKIKILRGCIFKHSKPAIFGVKVLSGVINQNMRLMKSDGKIVGRVKSIQSGKESIKSAKINEEVAIAVDDAIVNRNVKEEDILYSFLSFEEVASINPKDLTEDELKVINEIKGIKREKSEE